MFKEGFVKRILEAERRIAKGKKIVFRSIDEISNYFDK